TLDVSVRGPIDERTGMVIDLGELKRIVSETVVDRFDHADLNADPLFRDRVPTTENIALAIWDLLAPKLGPDRLAGVRVWEDAKLEEVTTLAGVITTGESLARAFWRTLAPGLPTGRLSRITVVETAKNRFEYRGGDA